MGIITNEFNIKILPKFDSEFKILSLVLKDEYRDKKKYIKRIELMVNEHINYFESIAITNESLGNPDYKEKCLWILIRKNDELERKILKSLDKFEKINKKIYDTTKIKLILFSLPKYKCKNISNVVGSLYQFVEQKIKFNQLVFLEYKVFNGVISQNVKTLSVYSKVKPSLKTKEKYPTRYKFNQGHLSVSKKSSPDDYIITSKVFNKNKRNTIKFFEAAKTLDDFTNTKIYYFNKMLEDIKKYLYEYIIIDYKIIEEKKYEISKNIEINKKLFEKEKYNIVNKSLYDDSIIEKLKLCLNHAFPSESLDISTGKKINKNKINFVIVSDKNDYKNANIQDKYERTIEYVRQHVIVDQIIIAYQQLIKNDINDEDKRKFNKPIKECMLAKVLLTDSLIKNEVIHNEMKLHRFLNNYFDDKEFVMPIKMDKKLYFISMKIENNKLSFHKYDESYLNVKYNFKHQGYIKSNVMVYNILDTDQILLPNIEYVMDKYNKVNNFGRINKNDILSMIEKYELINVIQRNEKQKEYWVNKRDIIIDKINKISRNDLTSLEVRDSLKPLKECKSYGFYGSFIEFVNINFGKLISSILNVRDEKKVYLKGFEGISYYYEKNKVRYSVGFPSYRDIKPTISKAIRFKTISNADDEFLNEYFKLLDVAFIRYKQATVIPFPFKYIREYIKMNKSLPDISSDEE